VKCSVVVRSLDDHPEFNALSYTWGNLDKTTLITINGHVVPVTVNLEIALRHLRDHKNRKLVKPTALPIWVDAICINQPDLNERNHQVRLMKDIYTNAVQVLAWLGTGDDHTDWIFEQCNRNDLKRAWVRPPPHTAFDDLDETFSLALDIQHIKILTRPWWTRVWVIEEVVLAASDPVVICGYSSAYWSDYMHLVEATIGWGRDEAYPLWESNKRHPDIHNSYKKEGAFSPNAFMFRNLREEYLREKGIACCEILRIAEECQATDPRDYLYGCLSILKPEVSLSINIDYTEHPFKVFQDAMRAIINYEPKTLFRWSIQSVAFNPSSPVTPSWVPDFANMYDGYTAGLSSIGLEKHGRADKWWRLPQVSLSSGSDILRISGIRLDTVSEVVVLDPFNKSASTPKTRLQLESKARTALAQPIPSSHHCSALNDLKTRSHILDIFTCDLLGNVTDEEKDVLWEVLMRRKSIQDTLQAFSGAERHHLKKCTAILWDRHQLKVLYRSLIISKAGFVAVGSRAAKEGDELAYLFGMSIPVILRPGKDGKGYTIVGWAYVSGLMNSWILDEYDQKQAFHNLETTFNIY
jgi:hypothetical protein